MWDARTIGALALLVLSVAALDSLNPSTLGPAVVLALGEHPARRLAALTAGVFLVSTAGGLIVLFALGRAVLARVAHPSAHTRHLLEIAIGVVLIVSAALLWVLRDHLRTRLGRGPSGGGRSSFLLGAGIMAVELPTAFPYFAAILATVGAVHGALGQTVFVVFYNVVFVAPLALLTVVVALTGERYRNRIARLSDAIARHGPVVLPIGVACIGAALVVVGVVGL
jgi:cytochrome c biogenesis protein CcdA